MNEIAIFTMGLISGGGLGLVYHLARQGELRAQLRDTRGKLVDSLDRLMRATTALRELHEHIDQRVSLKQPTLIVCSHGTGCTKQGCPGYARVS